jgi:hypothetical protein
MRELLNGAATLGLAAIVVTLLGCVLGWAQTLQGGDR